MFILLARKIKSKIGKWWHTGSGKIKSILRWHTGYMRICGYGVWIGSYREGLYSQLASLAPLPHSWEFSAALCLHQPRAGLPCGSLSSSDWHLLPSPFLYFNSLNHRDKLLLSSYFKKWNQSSISLWLNSSCVIPISQFFIFGEVSTRTF